MNTPFRIHVIVTTSVCHYACAEHVEHDVNMHAVIRHTPTNDVRLAIMAESQFSTTRPLGTKEGQKTLIPFSSL